MTGTIDLSIEQLNAIYESSDSQVVRVLIHPRPNKAVFVEIRSLSYGDVLVGHFYVLRNGHKLTTQEYDEGK